MLKPETEQPTGSFKIRGTANELLHTQETTGVDGAVSASTGNHAIAVTHIAPHLGVPTIARITTTVCSDRVSQTRNLGASIDDSFATQADAMAAAEISYQQGGPPLVNQQMVDFVRPAATAVAGAGGVRSLPPRLAGDDFAWSSERWPAVYAFIGVKTRGSVPPPHNPRFDFDEDTLDIGRRFIVGVVQQWPDGTP